MFEYDPHLIAEALSYVLMVWFIFIFIGNALNESSFNSKLVRSSLVMSVAWSFYSACFIFGIFDPLTYYEILQLIILIDSVTAFIILTNQFISRYSAKLSLTLAFAVLCHSMLLLYETTTSSEVKTFTIGFYAYYDEFIATVGILQLLVSYDSGIKSGVSGFTRSLRASQGNILRGYSLFIHCSKGCIQTFKQKNRERRNWSTKYTRR